MTLEKTKGVLLRLGREVSHWIIPWARVGIILGCVGIAVAVIAMVILKLWFLPLGRDETLFGLAIFLVFLWSVGLSILSAVVAGVSTLCAWQSLSVGLRVAGVTPGIVVLVIWLLLITFTGM